MTSPRAVGVRAPYDAVPARVRSWVDAALGSPVVETHEQIGGMSPGCATRVVCADGTRAFVKAVGSELNPDTPTLFRREALVLQRLGSHPLWAGLLASYDDAEWVALVLEDVEGRHPDFHEEGELGSVLRATDALAEVLRHRVPEPSSWASDVALVSAGDTFRRWAHTLDTLDAAPLTAPVPAWVRHRSEHWAGVLAAAAVDGEGRLAHWDVRNDNMLRRPTGEIVFVDWGNAALAPAWADPLLARLERVDEAWFDTSVTTSPHLVAAGDEVITAFLIGFGAHLAVRSVTALDVNLPTLNDFRTTESRRFLDAAARRLGLPA